jgi:hypothetical protein
MQYYIKETKNMIKKNDVSYKLSKPCLAVISYAILSTNTLTSFAALSQQTQPNNVSEDTNIEKIEIQGKGLSLINDAISASEGVIGQQEILNRPLLRVGEILELVPGMVCSGQVQPDTFLKEFSYSMGD